MGIGIPWSDLPKELTERIGKLLETHIDVLCFRAVCTTWRSSLPPLVNSPLLPLQIPFDDLQAYKGRTGYHLIESTVYIFQPLDHACKGWLIKVVKTADGKLRVLNPLTGRLIRVLPDHMPKVLNLLDFRVSQVCKSYHVQYFNPSRPSFKHDFDVGHVRKILLLSDQTNSSSFSLMAIDRGGSLRYLKSEDEKWTKLKNDSSYIGDIIVYKGNFYAVDKFGETVQFDSSFNETTVTSRLSDVNKKKRLVESRGQLFLVDSSLEFVSNVEIKMYRLDEEQNKWIEVQTLGDQIFFAANDCCFSVSSRDFGECRGNCIYYVTGGVYYDDEDSDDDFGCCCYCDFSDDDRRPVAGNDEFSYPISNDDHKINDSGNGSGGDDEISYPISDDDHEINDAGGKSGGDNDVINTSISNDDQKNNDSSSKSGPLREKQPVDIYEGVFDHNTGVFAIEDGKLGSLLSFLDYAEILWPPPSWLNREDQAPSHDHEIAESLLSISKQG
ncbi:putative F-box protein At5g60060 [Lycium ferocissimum]|uniref:putative F-box protein At5g60060 n=1 Tax=Lycium ferocissimum TaxID=112874 RepID=UPI002815B880|nr:putative F-box protein At5g60060 [Lycium ferocissimum]